MATPDDVKRTDDRATANHKGGRGVSNRGTSVRDRERNYDDGNFSELIPGRLYKAGGLNIGETDFSKRGVGDQFSRIIKSYHDHPGSEIVVTGGKSTSVRTGKRDADLGLRRAESAKELLVRSGVPPSAIRTEEFPESKIDPYKASSQQKANMRGATIEVIPPKKPVRTDTGFTDGSTYIKGKVRTPFDWLRKPPDLGPIRGKGFDPEEEEEKEKEKEKEKKKKPWRPFWWPKERKDNGSHGFLTLATVGLMAFFLPEFLEAAAAEYGWKKMKEYAEKKLKKRLEEGNKRNSYDQEKFMKEMLDIIKARGFDPAKRHPLYFLVNPETGNWVSRQPWHPLGVNAGHTLSHGDYGFAFAVEDAEHNQTLRGGLIESKEGFAWSIALKIDGVYIDKGTALKYVRLRLLKGQAVRKAKPSVGWIAF